MERRQVFRVLISVSDKENIVDFSRALDRLEIEIVSTGGTYKTISKKGIDVIPVEKVTNFPEMMGGRLKTLHPLIFGGILARDSDSKDAEKHNIDFFDMVVCNLYPFREAVSKRVDSESLIEQIDIGGPSLLRASAKNHTRVAVVSDPADYNWIIDEIKAGGLTLLQRQDLALKAFRHTAEYARFGEEGLPTSLHISGIGSPPLRYGENPHQAAIFYSDNLSFGPSISSAAQLQGKQLSYNNLLDFDAALSIVTEFSEPTAIVVKHTNPCGAASAENLERAYELAINTDPQSSFGGIISFNQEVSRKLAEKIISSFKEGVIAPSFTQGALEVLSEKKNLRVLETGSLEDYERNPTLRSLDKGWLLQETDEAMIDILNCEVVTKRKPTDEEIAGLQFGCKIVKHVKSNAIVFAKQKRTVGIGAGQMSRIDSVKIATFKSIPNPKDSVMASDAFFPFRDGIDEAAKEGITAVVQPGGSVRDQEVIDAANEHNMAMVFTGMRHFKH
ncbi:MAG: bifunctional phosphoribosylaminoimidazolecarboxamide formyltransferase/inosine monophosphate cyclohydrolase [Methanobacteriota archaeon]|nr:MAG: bifunctional phosphoribosylaminoimidazolecarboxamide formyltransferase/inosine monophosphate cyclohydrolase [Euryarchaeota archaeon]